MPYATFSVRLPLLALKLVSPLYWAVIEWEFTAREDTARVAWPDPFSVPVPRVVVPS